MVKKVKHKIRKTIHGVQVGSKGRNILVRDLETGGVRELDRFSLVRQIDPEKKINEYST